MRAKRIELIRLAGVVDMGKGVNQILYNLAFSPRIKCIDISNIVLGAQADTCEGIYKLIKISGSLEYLNLSYCGLFDGLSNDFYVALGENKTLKALLIDSNTVFTQRRTEFGKACAFNKKKNGSLEILSAEGGFDAANFSEFLKGMKVSEYDHEIWYGDKTAAAKFSGEKLDSKFLNPWKIIKLGRTNFNMWDSISEIKKHTNPCWPPIVHLFASGLEKFDLTQSQINNKKTLEVLACCIDNPINKTSIKVLNLSKNHINKEGGKILSEVIAKNTSIESLDLSGNLLGVSGTKSLSIALKQNKTLKNLSLYSNIVDVDGARALKETLLVNNTLEFLDLGSNRLREKGPQEIAEGLIGNKNTSLKEIALRFNFISEKGADKFFNMVSGTKLTHIYMRNNEISEPYLIKLDQRLKSSNSSLYIDEIEKVQYLSQEKIDRSIWISPFTSVIPTNTIKEFF
jgi:NLR family CARD domain-containing protein 3